MHTSFTYTIRTLSPFPSGQHIDNGYTSLASLLTFHLLFAGNVLPGLAITIPTIAKNVVVLTYPRLCSKFAYIQCMNE
jgi:hypothetical protein